MSARKLQFLTLPSIPEIKVEELREECRCEATLFLEKYRSQIEQTFGIDDYGEGSEETDLDDKKRRYKLGKIEKYNKYGKDKYDKVRKYDKYGKDGKVGKVGKDYKGGKDRKDWKIDEGGQYAKDGEERGDQFDKKRNGEEDGKIKEDFGSESTDSSQFTETESIQEEAFELKALQDALEKKILEICGEEMEGESTVITERGYIVFDRSDQSTVQKLSTISSIKEEEEYSFRPKYLEGEWMSDSERRARDYLNSHKIDDLFKFLGSHLVAVSPCNPIDFLINLLENCLQYRNGYAEPPLLFLTKHIESLFYSMDKMKTDFIELNQYHTGLFTLGITEYNKFPEIHHGLVHKSTFIYEALIRQRLKLNEMIHSFDLSTMTNTTEPYIIIGEAG